MPRRFKPASANDIYAEIRPAMQQLRLPAHGSRADQGTLRQGRQRIIRRRRAAACAQNQRIAWVFPFQNASQHNARRQFGFQILEAMHRDINPPIGQRFMDFLGEKPLAANIGQALILHLVARCRDDVFFQRAIFSKRGDRRARN
jgi:hypothetical protein